MYIDDGGTNSVDYITNAFTIIRSEHTINNNNINIVVYSCCCLPTSMTLASGGLTSFSGHLPSSAVTPSGSVHKTRGDNVGAVDEMICVVYVSVTKGA